MNGNRKTRELPENVQLRIWRVDDCYFGAAHYWEGTAKPMYECSARTALGCMRKLMDHATKGKQVPFRPKAKFSPED